jgi:hypothetical protein
VSTFDCSLSSKERDTRDEAEERTNDRTERGREGDRDADREVPHEEAEPAEGSIGPVGDAHGSGRKREQHPYRRSNQREQHDERKSASFGGGRHPSDEEAEDRAHRPSDDERSDGQLSHRESVSIRPDRGSSRTRTRRTR